MRTNLPITSIETPVPQGEFIYSRTDTAGRILEANDLFVSLSGFSREELIGQPHNVVRHPDMPPEAFDDLWRSFKAGRPWNGYVKNRRKDGGYYWVHAFASPVRENGQVVGYESVRRRAEPAVVRAVEVLYKRFRERRAGGLHIRDGRVLRTGLLGWLEGLPLGARFGICMLAILLAVLAIGVVGFTGLKAASESLRSVHADNMVPVGLLSDLRAQNNRARLNLALGGTAGAPMDWHAAQIADSIQRAQAQWSRYHGTRHGGDELRLINAMRPDVERVFAVLEEGRQRLLAGDGAAALRLASQETVPEYLKVVGDIEQLLAFQDSAAATAVAEAERRYSQALTIFGSLIALAIAVTAYLNFGALRGLVRDIRALDTAIASIQRDGDLRHIVAIERRDELGRLVSSFNAMMANTQAILIQVRNAAQRLNAESCVLAETSEHVAVGAEASSEAATSTAAAVEQVTVAINEVAEHAAAAAAAVDESNNCSARGVEAAGKAAIEIGKLASMVTATTETIERLANSSADIGRIATVIKEIADQTNLLALNAAIEAARAGEQGRGFAVVADEVRKLAERTTHATADISSILDALHDETTTAVNSVRQGADQVKVGVTLAESAQAALASIRDATARSLRLVGDIAAATGEQSGAANAISRNVDKIAEMAEEGAAAVNSVAGASKMLASVSSDLDRAISRFKV